MSGWGAKFGVFNKKLESLIRGKRKKRLGDCCFPLFRCLYFLSKHKQCDYLLYVYKYGSDISHFLDMLSMQDGVAGVCSFRADSECAPGRRSPAPCAQDTPSSGGAASPGSRPRGQGWLAGARRERRCGGGDMSALCSLGLTWNDRPFNAECLLFMNTNYNVRKYCQWNDPFPGDCIHVLILSKEMGNMNGSFMFAVRYSGITFRVLLFYAITVALVCVCSKNLSFSKG